MRIPERLPLRKYELVEDKLILSNSTDEEGELNIYSGKSGEVSLTIYDGSDADIEIDVANNTLKLEADNFTLYFGASDDASIKYDGTDMIINPQEVGSGSLTIGGDIKLIADNRKIYFGAGNDAYILFDGTDLQIEPDYTGTGRVWFRHNIELPSPNQKIFLGSADASSIYNNNTYLMITGDPISITGATSSGDILIPSDTKSLILGAGSDATLKYDGTNLVVNAQAVGSGYMEVNGGIYSKGDLNFNSGSKITTDTNENLTILPGGTGYTIIGDASAAAHANTANDDLFVSGKFEVAGVTYHTGKIVMYDDIEFQDNIELRFGNDIDSAIKWSTANATVGMTIIAVDDTSQSVIMAPYTYRNRNFDHSNQNNPSLFIHSAKDPNTDNTEWIQILHDQTDGVIQVGSGDIKLAQAINLAGNSYTAGAPTVSGYVTIKVDGVNYKFAVEA